MLVPDDTHFMREAIRQAERAAEAGEVPVGAVIVHEGRIIARAHNQMETLRDATAHAEMIAITQASEAIGDWRLEGAEIHVTLEPCAMCAGALVLSRIGKIHYGADDPNAGACGTVFDIVQEKKLLHRIPVVKGVLGDVSAGMLRAFFQARRREAKKRKDPPMEYPV